MIELRTPRLHLIAATAEIAQAEVSGRAALADLLDAQVPADWPPPGNDEASARFFLEYLRKHPSHAGWLAWYFVALDAGDGERVAIGGGGFKGAPAEGAVEIGYAVIPRYQRRGFATEAVRALIGWAFSRDGVDRIVAQTLPESEASQSLLRKLGFRETAPREPGTLWFELGRV